MMNNKYKIIALFGEAGSGKDYIVKNIMKTESGKRYLNKIISCSMRPPREGEIDGVHYHFFKTPEELIKQDTLEFTIFKDWWYGTTINSLDQDKINIGVFNIKSIDQLINKDYLNRINCIPIYIKTYPKIRLLRQLQREKEPDCDEIIRRYLTDQRDFLNIPFHYHVIENNYDEMQPIINEILSLSRTMDKIN